MCCGNVILLFAVVCYSILVSTHIVSGVRIKLATRAFSLKEEKKQHKKEGRGERKSEERKYKKHKRQYKARDRKNAKTTQKEKVSDTVVLMIGLSP